MIHGVGVARVKQSTGFCEEALVRCWVSGAAHGARTLWCDSCGLRGVWVVVLVARIDTNVTVVVFVSAGCGV